MPVYNKPQPKDVLTPQQRNVNRLFTQITQALNTCMALTAGGIKLFVAPVPGHKVVTDALGKDGAELILWAQIGMLIRVLTEALGGDDEDRPQRALAALQAFQTSIADFPGWDKLKTFPDPAAMQINDDGSIEYLPDGPPPAPEPARTPAPEPEPESKPADTLPADNP